MTSLPHPALRRALRLVAVKSGEQLLVGSSKSAKQGRSSFSLNGARKGWQPCRHMTASDGGEAGAPARLPEVFQAGIWAWRVLHMLDTLNS